MATSSERHLQRAWQIVFGDGCEVLGDRLLAVEVARNVQRLIIVDGGHGGKCRASPTCLSRRSPDASSAERGTNVPPALPSGERAARQVANKAESQEAKPRAARRPRVLAPAATCLCDVLAEPAPRFPRNPQGQPYQSTSRSERPVRTRALFGRRCAALGSALSKRRLEPGPFAGAGAIMRPPRCAAPTSKLAAPNRGSKRRRGRSRSNNMLRLARRRLALIFGASCANISRRGRDSNHGAFGDGFQQTGLSLERPVARRHLP